LEQRRIEDLEAKMDDCARRGDKEGFQKCKAERDSYHKIKETRDTTEKDSQGHVTGFSHEGDWKKIPKNKAGRPVDPRGEVTHLSDLARREAERAAQDDVAEGAESSPVAGAIVNRIMRQCPDLLTQYGPKLISAAVDEVADHVGDVDEIGSSDVSGWVNQVERMLKENPPEAFGEAGIGQDLVTPQQRVQGAKSQKQTPTGKVVDTVKQAGKWLAGRGGPGREGPTYEGVNDIEDRGEYDREGDMAKDNIHTIVRNAKELESILSDNDNLPEWVQDKLANIKGMMTAVSEYMQTQHERDHEEMSGREGVTMAETQKKNSEKVTEYISMGSDKNYSEADPYKNYKIYVRKKPFGNTGMYTAHTEIDRKEFMGKGPSQAAAVQAVRDRIDFVLNAQQKVTGSSTIDFNVKFATDLLADPKQTFYAKLENVMGQPKLIIASADIASDPELLAAGDFKRSALRNRVSDKGQTTAPPGIPLTAKSLRAGDWIANGRYTVGNETTDSDGNRVFDLTYHSTAHTKSDKLRLNQPAFTLGTAREVDEASWGGSGPAGLKTPYAVYTKQNGQVKRVKTTNKIGQPMNTREAEAYVAAMRKRDPARWTHDTVWVAPADIDLDEAANPAQQAAIAIAMKKAHKKPEAVDENLRDWFGKEKWVRMDTKGNIKGDCARGSETEGKPKCLPRAKAHALGKKGRASAAQKKRREDPDPERRGKAINVATKVSEMDKSQPSQERHGDYPLGAKGTTAKPVTAKKAAKDMSNMLDKAFAKEKQVKEDDLDEACWKGYHKEGNKELFGKTVPNCVKNEDMAESHESCPECGGAMYPDTMINEKQDACYYKVKSRYKVWPSAYASGALVQCRKKGAKNWGNKSESATDSYTGVMESQGITDPKLLEVARRIDAFAKTIK
jgi:hypothetical protein